MVLSKSIDNIKSKLLMLLFLISIFSFGQNLDKITQEQWLEDLNHLVKSLKTKHKNAFHFVTEAKFDQHVEQLRTKIPNLSPTQILIELTKITAMIGDGHTVLKTYNYFKTIPIFFNWFNNELRVVSIDEAHKKYIGYKVVAINNTRVEIAFERTKVLTPQNENTYYLKNWSQYWLRNADALVNLGIIDNNTEVIYVLEDENQSKISLTLKSISTDKYGEVNWSSAYSPAPDFYNKEQPIWTKFFKEKAALYINFNRYPEWKEMRAITKDILQIINNYKTTKLIIDFRRNGGGNFDQGLYLIKHLKKTNIHVNGKVYVLTSRGTFSAAMSNSAHFRDQMNAILVGESPAQRPNGYSETGHFELANSKIKGTFSIAYYVFQDEDTPEMKLHHYLIPDFNSLKIGVDNILNWVLNHK